MEKLKKELIELTHLSYNTFTRLKEHEDYTKQCFEKFGKWLEKVEKHTLDQQTVDTRAELKEVTKSLQENKLQVTTLKAEIDKSLNLINACEEACKKQIEKSVQKLIKSNTRQNNNLSKERHRNIIIHGLEKEEKLDNWFTLLCKEHLETQVMISKVQAKETRRGKWLNIITLVNQSDKAKIFRNCHKLKNKNLKISITDDLTCEERAQAKIKSLRRKNQTSEPVLQNKIWTHQGQSEAH